MIGVRHSLTCSQQSTLNIDTHHVMDNDVLLIITHSKLTLNRFSSFYFTPSAYSRILLFIMKTLKLHSSVSFLLVGLCICNTVSATSSAAAAAAENVSKNNIPDLGLTPCSRKDCCLVVVYLHSNREGTFLFRFCFHM